MQIGISGIIHPAAQEILQQNDCEVKIWDHPEYPTQEELIAFCKEADGLISLWIDTIDQKLFEGCPSLKVVCNYAAGFNNMNPEHATKYGVVLCNTPGVLTESTADLAFTLMMTLSRNVLSSHKFILDGRWNRFDPLGHMGVDLRGKILSIVGMGKIGSEMARMAYHALGMRICYTARSQKRDAETALKARKVSFEELLQTSDVVSVHVDLNDTTHHLMNKHAFQLMKPEALFINTSRGSVHHESALIEALQTGEIAGAALDVCDPEPIQLDNPLLKMPNVVITPHIGSATERTRRKMAEMAAHYVLQALDGQMPENCLNKDVFRL